MSRHHTARVAQQAQGLLQAQRYQESEELLQTELAKQAGPAVLHNLLGVTYYLQSKFPQALAQFQRASQENPLFLESLLNLSIALCDVGYYAEAHKVYAEVLKLPATWQLSAAEPLQGQLAQQHLACAAAYRDLNQLPQALQEYQKALSLQPGLSAAQLGLGKLYLQLDRLAEAQQVLEALIQSQPEESQAYLQLGLVHYRQGAKDRARQYWQKAGVCAGEDSIARAYARISRDLEEG